MYKFAFEGTQDAVLQSAIRDTSSTPGQEHNRSVLTQMQVQSGAVRDLYQVRSLPLAEGAQERVVGMADNLDVKSLAGESKRLSQLAQGATDAGSKKGLLSAAMALGTAAASPFIERARLGAIQLRQGREGAAEITFADAIKVGVPSVSLGFESVRQLHQAVIDRHEELKVKRTLPEVFKANVDWIDTQTKDGRVDREELTAASGKAKNITASTLVNYLLRNYDNIDLGIKGIDAEDIRRHWEAVKPKDAKMF
jgi:hypothetical protein